MDTVYGRIEKLMEEKGITGYRLCMDLGLSKGFMTELRKGRTKSVSMNNAKKIADYFDVPIEYLFGSEEPISAEPHSHLDKERVLREVNCPERSPEKAHICDRDLKEALWGDAAHEITNDELEELKSFAQFILERKRRKG